MPASRDPLQQLVKILEKPDSKDGVRREFPALYALWQSKLEIQAGYDMSWPEGFLRFLKDLVCEVVGPRWNDPRQRMAARGAMLWYQTYFRSFLNPRVSMPDLSDLKGYWARAGGASEWQQWCRIFGLPRTTENPFYVGKSTAYEWMVAGRKLILEALRSAVQSQSDAYSHFDFREYRQVLVRSLQDADPDVNVESLSVFPILQDTKGQVHSPGELVESLLNGRIVLVEGEAGTGKSTLLRYLTFQLLQKKQGVVLMDDHSVEVMDAEVVAREWTGTMAIGWESALKIARHSIKTHALTVVVDNGERWIRKSRRVLASQVRNQGLGLLIGSRQPNEWSRVANMTVRPVWVPASLRRLMVTHGNDALWHVLESLAAAGRLTPRPWEYALMAQFPTSSQTSPVELLDHVWEEQMDSLKADGKSPQYLGRWRRGLERLAWQAVLDEQETLSLPTENARRHADLGIRARLVVRRYDGQYVFTHALLRDFLAAHHACTLEPEAALEAVAGLTDWEDVLAWAVEVALARSKQEWSLQLGMALARLMRTTALQTGWLQGAQVLGVLLKSPFVAEHPKIQEARHEAEATLLKLSDHYAREWWMRDRLGESLGKALLYLAPWTESTVATIRRVVYDLLRSEMGTALGLVLLPAPQIAPGFLERMAEHPEKSNHLWWQILGTSRAPGITPAILLEAVGQVLPGTEAAVERLQAGVGALCRMGSAEAAYALVNWLLREAQGQDEKHLRSWRDALGKALEEWPGSAIDLWGAAEVLLKPATPLALWYGYVLGAMRATGAEGAVHLVALAKKIETEWDAEMWTRVGGMLKAYGDERVVEPVIQLALKARRTREETFNTEDEKAIKVVTKENEETWALHQRWYALKAQEYYLLTALTGEEGRAGILWRLPAERIVEYLRCNALPDDVHSTIVAFILQWRDEPVVEALGKMWRERAEREGNLDSLQSKLYLLPGATDDELRGWLEDELLQEAALGLATRLGRWELALLVVKSVLHQEGYNPWIWDAVERAARANVTEWLPLLLQAYMAGKEWLLTAALQYFPAEAIDAVLPAVLDKTCVDEEIFRALWVLGTPEALRRVLTKTECDLPDSVKRPCATFREVSWPVLADWITRADPKLYEARGKAFSTFQGWWADHIAWPVGVAQIFFSRVDDSDKHVREQAMEILNRAIRAASPYVWAEQESVYVMMLESFVSDGTQGQRRMAVRWLAQIEHPAARNALDTNTLRRFLWEPELVRVTLDYIGTHERMELLPDMKSLWKRWADEAKELNHSAVWNWGQGLWVVTGEAAERASTISANQMEMVSALIRLGEGDEILLATVRREGIMEDGVWLDAPSLRAAAGLIGWPKYLPTLVKTVLDSEQLEPVYIIGAVVTQRLLLVPHPAGGWGVRKGVVSMTPEEWAQRSDPPDARPR